MSAHEKSQFDQWTKRLAFFGRAIYSMILGAALVGAELAWQRFELADLRKADAQEILDRSKDAEALRADLVKLASEVAKDREAYLETSRAQTEVLHSIATRLAVREANQFTAQNWLDISKEWSGYIASHDVRISRNEDAYKRIEAMLEKLTVKLDNLPRSGVAASK